MQVKPLALNLNIAKHLINIIIKMYWYYEKCEYYYYY